MKLLSYIFILTVVLSSCSDSDVKAPARADYFPLKTGRYYIYNADSIPYQGNTKKPDTIRFQLKDTITGTFKDQSGQTAYRVEEYRRALPSNPWRIQRVFSRLLNNTDAEEVNGNLRYVKLSLPVAQGKTWNPNVYNTLDSLHEINGQYIEVDKTYAANGLKFNQTALVQLQNDSNLVNLYEYNERYAAGIGLVATRHDSVFHSIVGPIISEFGYRFKQTLIDYGPK